MKKSAELDIENFLKRASWEKFSREEEISEGRKIIPCNWVFKIKYEINDI